MEDRRVVVTGLGTVNALGHNVEEFWSALIAGRSGIRTVSHFDASELPCKVASEVVDFDPSPYMDTKEISRTDPYVQYAVSAAKMAVKDAQLSISDAESERCGVLIGTGIGGMQNIQEQSFKLFSKGPRYISPFMIPSIICNMASGTVAIALGMRGPSFGIVSACSSGSHAIGEAYRCLQCGDADVMVAGGTEAAVQILAFSGFVP